MRGDGEKRHSWGGRPSRRASILAFCGYSSGRGQMHPRSILERFEGSIPCILAAALSVILAISRRDFKIDPRVFH
jgi:hypothetical protein